jgi:phenylacetate-CoA ligase
MNSQLLALYHRLPGSARSAVATMRGWYLNRWRYGAATSQLTVEALERDRWTTAQWDTWRAERLGYILHRAATQVPFYRDQWQARRARGDRASWELLENWPLLEKDAVRANPRAFVADDCDLRRMCREQTSGTTGKSLEVWRSKPTVSTLYAIAEARTRAWDGIPDDARWARLGGQLVVPVRQRKPPFWVWNAAGKQLYLSSYHLAPDLIPHYLEALARYKIVYLAGYPSSLQALAHEVLRLGRRDLQMAGVYTNAEPVLPEQRELISAAFQCPVRETYGMTEAVAAASECAHGRLHQWPEIGYPEVLEDGELIGTGLLNPDMPLIRYRVGDPGRLPELPTPSACGRTLPAMGSIDGRTNDLLFTADGRRVFWLNPVFYGLSVRQSQIVQEQIDLLRVRVAPAVGSSTSALAQTIIDRLRERMGNVRVIVDQVDEVPRTANGKLRAVICELSAAERTAILERGQRDAAAAMVS